MKRLFTLFLILFSIQETKGQLMWERTEPEPTGNGHYIKVMVQDSLVFLYGFGHVSSPVSGYKIFYSCYNFNGKRKWFKYGPSFHFSSQEQLGDLIIDSDSMLAINRYYHETFKFDFQKIRMMTGDTLRASRFSALTALPIARINLLKEPDGSYSIAGSSNLVSFTKLDSAGKPVFSKVLPSNSINYPLSFLRKCNGNYVVDATRRLSIHPGHAIHPILIELNPKGDTVRTRTLILENPYFAEENQFKTLIQTRKGDFLISGGIDTIVDMGIGSHKYFVAKVDSHFKLKWKYTNKGVLKDYHINKISELADSSFALLASSSSNSNYAIIKISNAGNYISHTTYSSAFCNQGLTPFDWQILPDGSAVVAGRCKRGFTYVAKIAGVGQPAKLSCFPSVPPVKPDEPADTSTITPEPTKTPADLYVYDLTGRIVKKMVVMETDIAKIKIDLASQSISNGIYICKLINAEGKVIIKRILLLR